MRLRYLIAIVLIPIVGYATIDLYSPEFIQARIKPVGEVNIATPQGAQPVTAVAAAAASPAVASADTGKKIYDSKCVVCHGSGLAGAPKFGDQGAWQPRIAEGIKTLLDHATNGYKAMPPKGTCMECTATDLEAAINYMVSAAKGK